MNRAERYEEHRRRVDEILTRAEANARRNMWRRFVGSTAGGAVGYALLGTFAYSAVHHVPWDWAQAGIRAGTCVVFSSLFWACLMWWDRRANPLRRR